MGIEAALGALVLAVAVIAGIVQFASVFHERWDAITTFWWPFGKLVFPYCAGVLIGLAVAADTQHEQLAVGVGLLAGIGVAISLLLGSAVLIGAFNRTRKIRGHTGRDDAE